MIKRGLIIFSLALTHLLAIAQQIELDKLPVINYTSPKEYILGDVTFSGTEHFDEPVLLSFTGLQVGKKITVPGDDITRVVERLWEHGLFSDIKVTTTKIEEGKIFIDIFLKERSRLSTMEIKGLKKSEQEDIREKIKLRQGSQITENILNNTHNIIKNHFVEKGFFHTDVTFKQEQDPDFPNGIKLTIDIDKNNRVKISEIVFEGNSDFSDTKLQRLMKKTNKKNWNIFKSSKYVEADFKEDKEKILEKYNANGYRDAKLLSDSIYPINKDRIGLKITLYEGRQYFFRDIEFIGNTKFPSDYLSVVLGIGKGDVYDQSLLDKRIHIDDDAISAVYMNDGYLFSQINPVEAQIDGDSIDLEVRIYEGQQATINKVIITGNTKTNEHVARREIRTLPGELFNRDKIIRSVRELAQLGHFDPEKINPKPLPNPADGTVDLKYELEEKANDQFEISGGWGAGMIIGSVGLSFNNFAIRNFFKLKEWRPVPSGDGQTLRLNVRSNGRIYQSYSLSFIEPWFGGKKKNTFSFSYYHSKQNYDWRSTAQDRYFISSGLSLGLGKRLNWPDDYFQLYNQVSIEQYALKDWPGSFIFSNGTSNNLSFLTSITRNSAGPNPIYPMGGSNFTLSLQLTPPYSLFNSKDYKNLPDNEKYKFVEYHKWTFKADWYSNLAGKLVLYSRANFGFLGYYNRELGPSPFEGYDLGGDGLSGAYQLYGVENIGLRGYENGSLTPQVIKIIDGQTRLVDQGIIYNKFTLELRYPLTLKPQASIYALTFVEAGNAWKSFNEYNPYGLKRSAGVGIRAFLPMFGLLGIDWAYGFDDVYDLYGRKIENKNGPQWHFVIGQQF